jgi:hypothetical protein
VIYRFNLEKEIKMRRVMMINAVGWVILTFSFTPVSQASFLRETSIGRTGIKLCALSNENREAIWIETTKDGVRSRLKDPGSAVFKDVYFKDYEATPMVCGKVNSKNGFGGMTGFQRFVASGSELVFLEEEVSDFNKAWNKICK